jgi:hypothetical protein
MFYAKLPAKTIAIPLSRNDYESVAITYCLADLMFSRRMKPAAKQEVSFLSLWLTWVIKHL